MRARDALVAVALLLVGRRPPKQPRPREVPPGDPNPRAELLAIALFSLAALCACAFVAVYALDRIPNQTQFLGLALGLALLFVAAGLIVTAHKLIVTEQLEHAYPPEEHREDQEAIENRISDSGSRITRKRLFGLALGGAAGAIGVAVLAPVASLGPVIDIDPFYATPWRKGRRLVDENGKPWRASDIEESDFYTAFPEGADKENIASPVVVVRVAARYLDLPPANRGYDADGVVAYSKICTHAGCAIALYRTPLFQPHEPKPALVCPCHYSTFNPGTGGTVEFGPAGRKLPMLPLEIDADGFLRAAGTFDEPVGPSWWGVRMRGAHQA